MIRAALFDFNGTMFFDQRFQEASWRAFLEPKIGRAVTEEEFQTCIHGRNMEFTLSHFFSRPFSRREADELEEEKEAIYRGLCLQSADFRLAEGLPEFLDALRSRGVPMNIATASALPNVRFFFAHLPLARWFDPALVVYNDGALPGKPAPDLYLAAAARIGADIGACAVFEDARSGLEAARRAGAGRIVGVASMQTPEALRAQGATDVALRYDRALLHSLFPPSREEIMKRYYKEL